MRLIRNARARAIGKAGAKESGVSGSNEEEGRRGGRGGREGGERSGKEGEKGRGGREARGEKKREDNTRAKAKRHVACRGCARIAHAAAIK
jgi:hypothetical protein